MIPSVVSQMGLSTQLAIDHNAVSQMSALRLSLSLFTEGQFSVTLRPVGLPEPVLAAKGGNSLTCWLPPTEKSETEFGVENPVET
jgi:hypothetical protein